MQACPAFPCTIKDKQNKTQQLMEELAIIRHKLNSFEEQSHAGTQMPIHLRATAISFRLMVDPDHRAPSSRVYGLVFLSSRDR